MTTNPASRRCTSTGLRLTRTNGQTVVRVARPSYGALNPQLRSEDISGAGTWGRWDVPGHRTVYVADREEIAYRELLAYLAPSVGVKNTRLSQVFTEDEGPANNPKTLFEAIQQDWDKLFHVDPCKIVQGWREARRLYSLTLPQDGWAVDVEHGESIDAVNRALAQQIAAKGIRRLDRSHLCGESRDLTVMVAQWIRAQILDDGSLPHGIRYSSKHADDGGCWAIWLRRVDDGADSSTEPIKSTRETYIEPPERNSALERAATALGLKIL